MATTSSVIKKFRPKSFKSGNIFNVKGNIIGKHEGIINYTIGQRRGIKIASDQPLYVIKINATDNSIVVGPKKFLYIKKLKLRNINILGSKEDFRDNLFVKVRSTGKLLKANVNFNQTSALVEILEDETGISPGQACVFYSKDKIGDKLLGGGWIDETYNKNLSHN